MAPTPGFLPSFASSPPATLLYSKDKKPRSFPASPIPTQLSRRICALLVFSILCLTVGLGGMAFTVISLRRPPRTVTVFRCGRAEDSFRTYRSNSLGVEGLIARPKVLGFVGVQTGFMSRDLRMALRSTWFPGNPEGFMKLEQSTGLAFRFVIGRTKNAYKLADIKKEDETHHDFLFIDVEEEDARPPYKMLAFFKAAFNHFDAEFYVKADDDIYLRPDRLATLLAKDRTHQHTYIGCMKKGPIVTNPKLKWYESSGHLFGNEYFIHASRQIYALSREVVASLIEARNDSLRIFDNEDVTVGSWMLAMNVKHEDNRALCEPKCTPNSIAIWDISRCSGLCKPADRLRELHNISVCSQSPTLPPEEET